MEGLLDMRADFTPWRSRLEPFAVSSMGRSGKSHESGRMGPQSLRNGVILPRDLTPDTPKLD